MRRCQRLHWFCGPEWHWKASAEFRKWNGGVSIQTGQVLPSSHLIIDFSPQSINQEILNYHFFFFIKERALGLQEGRRERERKMICWHSQYSFRTYLLFAFFLNWIFKLRWKNKDGPSVPLSLFPFCVKNFFFGLMTCVHQKIPIVFDCLSPLGRIIHPQPCYVLIARNTLVSYISDLLEPVMYSRCSQVWMLLNLLVQMTLILGLFMTAAQVSTLLVSHFFL